jgi:hypothetical protein
MTKVTNDIRCGLEEALAFVNGTADKTKYHVHAADTIAAMEAARRGEVVAFETIEEMFADLHEEEDQ